MDDSPDTALITTIRRLIRAAYPNVQGIYLYGSAAAGMLGPDSDVDIAVLLPHEEAKAAGCLALSETRFALEEHLGRPVDLVNARQASIVLQKEIISTGACVFTAAQSLVDEYEMIVLSLYGKLNDERREILAEFRRTWRAYRV